MIVLYSRVSTLDQNPDRQLQDKGYDYVFTDYCSGSIPLFERPKGQQVKKLLDEGKLTELHIHSIDRLGRNTLDVLTTWEELTSRGIIIVCKNPSIRNITEDGKIDKFSELLISILSMMGSFERGLIRERQMEGIKIRKEKNLYTGRRVGTTDTPERLLNKDKSKRILDYLDKGYPYHEISKIIGCSPTTIVKVKKTSQMVLN
jgi:DNA invertase Pin-like site-specific DNA recombinase